MKANKLNILISIPCEYSKTLYFSVVAGDTTKKTINLFSYNVTTFYLTYLPSAEKQLFSYKLLFILHTLSLKTNRNTL